MTGVRADPERGSATVWMLALSGVLALIGAACVLVGAAAVARHRATSAADLTALAAAGRAALGEPDPCATAAGIAARNHAELAACDVRDGGVVDVRVRVVVRFGPIRGAAVERARAGPAPPDPDRHDAGRSQKTRSSSGAPAGRSTTWLGSAAPSSG